MHFLLTDPICGDSIVHYLDTLDRHTPPGILKQAELNHDYEARKSHNIMYVNIYINPIIFIIEYVEANKNNSKKKFRN